MRELSQSTWQKIDEEMRKRAHNDGAATVASQFHFHVHLNVDSRDSYDVEELTTILEDAYAKGHLATVYLSWGATANPTRTWSPEMSELMRRFPGSFVAVDDLRRSPAWGNADKLYAAYTEVDPARGRVEDLLKVDLDNYMMTHHGLSEAEASNEIYADVLDKLCVMTPLTQQPVSAMNGSSASALVAASANGSMSSSMVDTQSSSAAPVATVQNILLHKGPLTGVAVDAFINANKIGYASRSLIHLAPEFAEKPEAVLTEEVASQTPQERSGHFLSKVSLRLLSQGVATKEVAGFTFAAAKKLVALRQQSAEKSAAIDADTQQVAMQTALPVSSSNGSGLHHKSSHDADSSSSNGASRGHSAKSSPDSSPDRTKTKGVLGSAFVEAAGTPLHANGAEVQSGRNRSNSLSNLRAKSLFASSVPGGVSGDSLSTSMHAPGSVSSVGTVTQQQPGLGGGGPGF